MEINEKEIAFSQAIKAGKRIYYLDVKKSKKSEMYLTITESKKIVSGEGDDSQVSFEKHKIFLYKEDFEKFMNGLQQSIRFIEEQEGLPSSFSKRETTIPTSEENSLPEEENGSSLNEEIKIDIDF
ncbi:MAG: PUR family DNA/RNA-binding protein [Bacteroides sp.]|nr:PUR family DNA/RNA-binding protein [Bacteroides sp.]